MTTRVEIHAPNEHRVHVRKRHSDDTPLEEITVEKGSTIITYIWGGQSLEIEEGS